MRQQQQQLVVAGTNSISLEDVEPVDVRIRDLSVTVDISPSILDPSTYPELFKEKFGKKKDVESGHAQAKTKVLINSVSALLKPGTLTAIFGGSGSGKTTLLNTMAERITTSSNSRLSQTGTTLFNGSPGVQSVRHAYVMQQDVLLPSLTVRETLQYSAELRLPPSVSAADRKRIVEEVILELGLKECADTRIGNSIHRGCSGGEKRRVSIGVQMLANPSVLFLDEPTTGLDATSAFQLVRTLKTLAAKGRTIVTTIHQPRSEIWDLFDNLILLTKGGSSVYSGPAKNCLAWFEGLGYELPVFVNPAEFVIDLSAIDNRTPEFEEESNARVQRLKASWVTEAEKMFGVESLNKNTGEKAAASPGTRRVVVEQHAGFVRQLRVQTSRTSRVTVRDPMGMAAALLEAVLMGLVNGYIFYNLARDQSGIRSREGALYTASALQGYLFLMFEVYRLTIDMPTFDREHSEGVASSLPWLLSRRLARLFTEDIPVPFLFSVIFYFMTGFDRGAAKFFTFFAIVLLNHYIAVACATACVAAVRNFAGATLVANLNYTLQSMACGFFIQSNTIPPWTRWLKYVAYAYYVMGALCGNEFEGSFYGCPFDGGPSNPACAPYTGRYIMDSLGFPENWVWRPIVVLAAFVVFFFALSWVGLETLQVEMTISRARSGSEADLSAGKEKLAKPPSLAEVRTIDVGLDRFALTLDKRSLLPHKPKTTKVILNPVTGTFQAGVLNVIMGPSGSGKTSLLNAMALRLGNSFGTRYRPSGEMTFNGAVPSETVVRSVCSYVCQDDDALLPSLTVRETLRFAAGLRLPPFMTAPEKHRRAEEALLKMGLRDCANNLIGNDLVKGISGGEKRRVSIAVQILTDPHILLLDEPTSGLDAFTASSIMEVLLGLAQEGRTIILTIHQARSDLFSKHFGNVLLLARGGSPVYSGPARSMLGYFKGLGFACPKHTNPADFALDLITIDLQEQQREADTRQRVKGLVEAWQQHKMEEAALRAAANPDTTEGASQPVQQQPRKEEARLINIKEEELEHSSSDDNTTAKLAEQPTMDPDGRPPPHSNKRMKSTLATPAELGALVRKRAGFLSAFPILLDRATLNLGRQPDLILARTMQVIGLGLVLTLFIAPIHHDFYSIQTRIGFVQQVGALYFVGMLQNVAIYPSERDVFYRESDDYIYSVEPFLATYTLLEVPFEVVSALMFGILADLAVGLPRTAEMYFVASFVCFAIVSCGESLGIMFNTLFSSHTGFAVNLTSVFLSVAQIMAGIMSIDMPKLFQAMNYLSPIRYAVRAFAVISLRGVTFTCNAEQMLPDGQCVISTGEQVLELYELDVDPVVNILALLGCTAAYRVVAWGLLRVVRTRSRSSR
ncbi:P-loop containing nucleoside triphosphate hydrolase protein [Diplogelasinospora grovesii]|uniref:P-loop containing nucleoside triphosphate hydrolase protein n=1 Tax=Diplogelasinospora grovesii TaxID=303347 RepID=A0AAN6N2G1_9PEZI|nr:P-loop containing nucleoside triphosphate hydrolase protein [Diplogelasinospora grovesii]